MSDEPQVLRTIDWRSVFPFTQLFRAFRVAIHPAKLILALLAICIIYSLGRSLDALWPDSHTAIPGEISMYEASGTRADFTKEVDSTRESLWNTRREMVDSLHRMLAPAGTTPPPAVDAKAHPSVREIKHLLADRRDRDVKAADETYSKSGRTTENAETRDAAVRAAYASADSAMRDAKRTEFTGLGLAFLEYEADQIDTIAQGVISWNWTYSRTGETFTPGVLPSIGRFIFVGPGWAITRHPIYFLPMAIITLLVWSVIGGAIARLAAVHVAQDEKISVRQALRFSTNKLMSFFAAPIMPLLLVGIVALLLALIGWLSEIPYVGGGVSIIIGALFIVVIGIGILVACAVLGTVCGFGLMYPTIAVEGSDAFDAVSRSFSYVFARPWKIFIYSVIAVIYAAVTYVFLRFIGFLTLSLLNSFFTLWTHHTSPDGHTSLATSWPGPAGVFDLVPPYDSFSLTFAGGLTYGLISFWSYLFVALLGAYLLSYFVSVNTIMYYLLRFDVDATEIDDVYLEPRDDDFDDTTVDPATTAIPSGAAVATTSAVAASTPVSTTGSSPVASTTAPVLEPAITRPADLPTVPGSPPAPAETPHGDPIVPPGDEAK